MNAPSNAKQQIAAELAVVAAESQANFRKLAAQMLDTDLLVTAWGPAVFERASEANARGAKLCLEIRANDDGAAVVTIVAARGLERVALATMQKPVVN